MIRFKVASTILISDINPCFTWMQRNDKAHSKQMLSNERNQSVSQYNLIKIWHTKPRDQIQGRQMFNMHLWNYSKWNFDWRWTAFDVIHSTLHWLSIRLKFNL